LTAIDLPPVRVSGVAHTGSCSLLLTRRTSGECDTLCGYWTAVLIPIKQDDSYRFSAWVKGSPTLAGRIDLALTLRVLDKAGKEREAKGQTVTLSEGWQEIQGRKGPNTTLDMQGPWPNGAAFLILDFATPGLASQDHIEGDLWLDDVYFGLAH